MLHIETREVSQSEWRTIIHEFDDQSLLQQWEYAEVKSVLQGWKVVRHCFMEGTRVVGVAQASIKNIPFSRYGVVWINRGPLWRSKNAPGDPLMLAEMLEALYRYWVLDRGMYLRVAPAVADMSEYRFAIEGYGYRAINNSQWISARIDLRQDEEVLRMALDKKWRNSMAHAQKSGVRYTIGSDAKALQGLLNDYRALLKRKEFSSVTPEFIEKFQELLPPEETMLVLSARLGDESLGSILIARYGDIAEYLIGAVGPQGRIVNAGQYLLWNAILEMKQRGIKKFDVGGAHPQQTPPGIYHFKQGMGGVPYQLVGEFDAARGVVARMLRMVIPYLL